MHISRKIICFTTLLSFGANYASAEIYKFVDKDGMVFYTDCPGGGYFKLFIKATSNEFKERLTLAENGNDQAQYELGCNITNDYQKAFFWFQKAAKQGHTEAQNKLGILYYQGQGVPKDYNQAFYWYRKAAEKGYLAAQFNLGILYYQGLGVPQNYIEAHKWFNLAGIQGNTEAIENRKIAERHMTASQIAEAQRLSSKWQAKFDNQN